LQLNTFEVRAHGVMLSIRRPREDGPGQGHRKEEEVGNQ
jgi:hypothetical protein